MAPYGEQRGIQSIEVGGALLKALAHAGRALPLKELAAEAGMAPAKAHPYLVSFGKLGLIAQDAASGHYGLGPLAMQLGLISLQQLDPVALATGHIEALAARTGHTVAIAVWGTRGATIVRVARPASAIYVSMRHGTVLSLRGTASGLLFAAWLPRARVLAALRDEAAAFTSGPSTRSGQASFDKLRTNGERSSGRTVPPKAVRIDTALAERLDEVRREGLARVTDLLLPGVSALALPVFDARGAIVLALTAIGPSAVFDSRGEGAVAVALREVAAALSERLGGRPAGPGAART
ncbi:MAG: IclR family transcriptional regulator [Betaproteobacteria bacterium]|nr:IclR family transcriptional regulator [Betaproteobacteria bacterium]MCC6246532.1 IclR family transcriptional regulator [Rubrivivax sp.]